MENHPLPQLAESVNRINLQILECGYATIDNDLQWSGAVTNPICSRLYYILEGEFTIKGKNGIDYSLAKGGCYLLPAGYSFTFFCRERVEQIYFHLRLPDNGGMDILRNCTVPIYMPFSHQQGKNLLQIMKRQENLTGLKVQQQILDTLHDLLCSHRISLEPYTYSSLVIRTIRYIEAHLSVQINTSLLAAQSFVAASTLTRRFRQETGMSIGQYIDEQIMARAEHLLRNSTLSVSQISEQLGFCDQFYFSRKFREKFGVPPRDYRKNGII